MTRPAKIALTILGWCTGILLAILLLIMALSPVAKYTINTYGENLIGRQMHAERVLINPFSGGLTIEQFSCKEANGETDFVRFDQLYVQLAWPELMGKKVHLRHIHLSDFQAEVLTTDNGFNFSDILERFASEDTTARDTTPSSWRIALRDIRLVNGSLIYQDMVRNNRWRVDSVNLAVPGLYFDNQQSDAGLEFGLPTGGRVGVMAAYKMQSRLYDISLRLQDINTDIALPLVKDYLNIEGIGATVNGQIHLHGDLNALRNMSLSGQMAIRGLELLNRDKEAVAGMDELRVRIANGDLRRNNYLLDTLSLTGITAHYIKYSDEDNTLSRLFVEDEAQETPENPETPETDEAPLTWQAKYLLVTGRDIRYTDHTLKKDVSYSIDNLRLDGRNVASRGRNMLQLKAQINQQAELTASYIGELDPHRNRNNLRLRLTNLRLDDFSPYCLFYTAYPIESGTLALESETDIVEGVLDSRNKLVIDQLTIGKKERLSKAPYKSLPIKLGVRLLESAQKMIVLDVPVKGDLNNPQFRLNKVIGRAFLKIFFGPLMGVKDKQNYILPEGISGREAPDEESWAQMMELLGDEEPELLPNSAADTIDVASLTAED